MYLKSLTIEANISISRCCMSLRSASDNSMLFYYTKAIPASLMSKQVFILVFLYIVCVCNVNFEETVLYSMMLNPLVPLASTIKRSIILQLITVAAIKVCSEISFSNKSYHIEIGQLICKAVSLLVFI